MPPCEDAVQVSSTSLHQWRREAPLLTSPGLLSQCGFSNTCVQILNTLNVPYETVNILEDERLRSGMKEYSQWPTFPQVYINGEFYGGCDIMIGEPPILPCSRACVSCP